MNLRRALSGGLWLALALGALGCRRPSPQHDGGSPSVADEVLDRSERYGAVTVRYPTTFSRLVKPGFMVQRGDESFSIAGGPVPDGEATDLRALKEKVLAGPLRAARAAGSTVHDTTERASTCAGRPAIETRTLEDDSAGKTMLMRSCVFVHGKSGYFVLYRGPLRAGANDDPLLARMLDAVHIAPSDRDQEVPR